jgi:hypothetical protein
MFSSPLCFVMIQSCNSILCWLGAFFPSTPIPPLFPNMHNFVTLTTQMMKLDKLITPLPSRPASATVLAVRGFYIIGHHHLLAVTVSLVLMSRGNERWFYVFAVTKHISVVMYWVDRHHKRSLVMIDKLVVLARTRLTTHAAVGRAVTTHPLSSLFVCLQL